MGILKIKDLNGNFIDVPAIVGPQGPEGDYKILDVEYVPEINENNINKLIRYNGDIYAVSVKQVERSITIGDNLRGKKIKIDLPIFMRDYSTTLTDHKQIFMAGDVECYIEADYNRWNSSDTELYGDDVYIGTTWIALYYNKYYESHSKVWSHSEYVFGDDKDYIVSAINSGLDSYSAFKIVEEQLAWNKISFRGNEKEYDYFWIKGSAGTQIYLKYKFEKGMNWNEFINSEYNIDGKFMLDGGSAVFWTRNYSLVEAGGISYSGTEYQEIRPIVYELTGSTPEPT